MDMIFLVLFECLGQAQVPPATGDEPLTKERQERLEQFRREARDYEISVATEPQEKLRLRTDPVLHWGNPTRVGEDGAVFVWLRRGRPEAIGTIFSCRDNKDIVRVHEFHSLSQEPLRATFRGDVVWTPVKAGMEMKPLPGAAEPASSSPLRLTQMRTLAREFAAQSVDPEAGRIELRLMPQPLYRYDTSGEEIQDGALFALAHGTDPEVLLVFEARRNNQDVRWWYGLARFSDLELRVQHQGQEVWSVGLSRAIRSDIRAHSDYQRNTYVSFRAELLLRE